MISSAKLTLLISALSQVESNNDPHAFNYHEQAYGLLQIRQPVVDDINKLRRSPLRYTLEDAFVPDVARWMCARYLEHWLEQSGQMTYESAARIWNGGPDGWYQLSTLGYWRKVRAVLESRGLDSRGIMVDATELSGAKTSSTQWQPRQTKQSPAARSAFIPGTTVASSSRSDLATSSRFASSASAAKGPRSASFIFTIRPSGSKPARPPASPPPTSPRAGTLAIVVAFELP